MSELVIETSDLRKVYRSGVRRHAALDGLDLAVPAGGVHGFLGPNGSGKTTTLRLLLGLARPTSGTMRVLGADVTSRLAEVADRVGAVVEGPHFVPTLSGRKNLALLARTVAAPRGAVDQALEQVGLERRDRTPYAAYSSGMQQRLAIASALLKDPDLLILDEPTNGLDPAGISSIRELVRRLGDSGVTVLLSSHILAEVQQVCHSVSIVERGRLLASGPVEELLGDKASRTRLLVADPRAARHFLEGAGHRVALDGPALVVEGHEDPAQLTRLLAGRGLYVSELTEVRPTLEEFFLGLTGRPTDAGDRPGTTDPTDPASPTGVAR